MSAITIYYRYYSPSETSLMSELVVLILKEIDKDISVNNDKLDILSCHINGYNVYHRHLENILDDSCFYDIENLL